MKQKPTELWEDVYTHILADIAILSVPFIAIGRLGNVIIYSISCAVTAVSLAGLIARICHCIMTKRHKASSSLQPVMSALTVPYALALSALILYPDGDYIDTELRTSAAICILIWIAYFISLWRRRKASGK